MPEYWMHPSTWTHEQWLIVSIMGFIVLAMAVFLWRLYTLFKVVSKSTEKKRTGFRAGHRPGRR